MRLKRFLLLIAFCLDASAAQLTDVRVWAGPDETRVVLDLSAAADHAVFTLDKPDRVVIDLKGVSIADTRPRNGKGLVSSLRFGRQQDAGRVVIDLESRARPKTFLLPPEGEYGHRLVVDLEFDAPAQRTVTPQHPIRTSARQIVVAIDPGHGGEDPGAIGPRGTREKDIALQISRRLADLLERQSGIRAVLTRTGDYYAPLRKRIAIAQQANADLFVSIHADAFRDGRAHGSSVYVLSRKGASSEHARVLANRENAADLIGGVQLSDKDPVLTSVLVDVLQTAALEASLDVGQRVLETIGNLGHLHRRTVQRAGFAVLKAPDIPSLLVETAFISNREEERRLRDPAYQRKLAQSLADGISSYFRDYRPQRLIAGADVPPRQHRVRAGDTLSEIADFYGTSVATLRSLNGLRGDRITVGKTLQIP